MKLVLKKFQLKKYQTTIFVQAFNKVELIKKAFNDMNIINFENLEVIRNEKNI